MDYDKLSEQAIEAKKLAFPPYSNFRVGAALLALDETIFIGCNIEISSYSLTICAERTAVFKAVSEGERKFKAIAIASDAEDFISPCGACRQVISDLCGDIDVIMLNSKGEKRIEKISTLLPYAFSNKDLR